MPVLQRKELEASPLADLHAIASELGLEGYRALRKADLVAALLKATGADDDGGDSGGGEEPVEAEPTAAPDEPDPEPEGDEPAGDPEPASEEPAERDEPEETAGGVLDILGNGSGFIRVDSAGQSRDDVYVSPAQIRRCELRSGDQVEGPVRPPRRNERHPSLVRVASVNGRDPEPPEQRPEFSDLTPVFPTEKLPMPGALDGVPVGKGSRVAVGGPPGAGTTMLLREIVKSLSGSGLDVSVVLAGVRPEEVGEWSSDSGVRVSGSGFDGSPDSQAQQAELAIERAKRAVERGGDAVVVVDTLEALPPAVARRVFGAARKAEQGGSLTVFAATGMAWEPQRWATARVMLDPPASPGEAPKVSASRSGTLRADLLS